MAGSLFVQPDGEVFVDTAHADYDEVRESLLQFGMLTKRQEPLHVYQLTPLSLWQAAAAGWTARGVLTFLRTHSQHPLPLSSQQSIVMEMAKWGACRFIECDRTKLEIVCDDPLRSTIIKQPALKKLGLTVNAKHCYLPVRSRAAAKQILVHLGIPVDDQAGHEAGEYLGVTWSGRIGLRSYQTAAVKQFFRSKFTQSGIITMPCGAGKTVVGLAVLAECHCHTLIVTPSITAAEQWRDTCLQATTLTHREVGLYQTDASLKPVTIITYQMLSGRTKTGLHRHLVRLGAHPWGLVIYDEVHMLPAPLFRLAAELHSIRRLGLTATLVREDGAESDVYALVGPKCYEAGWRELEQQGYVASVRCVEIRIPLTAEETDRYNRASAREKFRIAGESTNKRLVIAQLLGLHVHEQTLIMGHFLDGLDSIASETNLPLITGQTPAARRKQLFDAFRNGRLHGLVLSRVANVAVDLPEAAVGIQVSGLYGSRQEEAQRLGRLLRPKRSPAVFYTLVAEDTVEVHAARRRQRFLVEQGYQYELEFAKPNLHPEGVSANETV